MRNSTSFKSICEKTTQRANASKKKLGTTAPNSAELAKELAVLDPLGIAESDKNPTKAESDKNPTKEQVYTFLVESAIITLCKYTTEAHETPIPQAGLTQEHQQIAQQLEKDEQAKIQTILAETNQHSKTANQNLLKKLVYRDLKERSSHSCFQCLNNNNEIQTNIKVLRSQLSSIKKRINSHKPELKSEKDTDALENLKSQKANIEAKIEQKTAALTINKIWSKQDTRVKFHKHLSQQYDQAKAAIKQSSRQVSQLLYKHQASAATLELLYRDTKACNLKEVLDRTEKLYQRDIGSLAEQNKQKAPGYLTKKDHKSPSQKYTFGWHKSRSPLALLHDFLAILPNTALWVGQKAYDGLHPNADFVTQVNARSNKGLKITYPKVGGPDGGWAANQFGGSPPLESVDLSEVTLDDLRKILEKNPGLAKVVNLTIRPDESYSMKLRFNSDTAINQFINQIKDLNDKKLNQVKAQENPDAGAESKKLTEEEEKRASIKKTVGNVGKQPGFRAAVKKDNKEQTGTPKAPGPGNGT